MSLSRLSIRARLTAAFVAALALVLALAGLFVYLRTSSELTGVIEGTGAPANGDGSLTVVMHMTLDDPVGGDMTGDFVGRLPVTLTDGSGALSTTVGVMLSEDGMPDLPNGTSIEVVDVQVRDPNDNLFAHPGVYLR